MYWTCAYRCAERILTLRANSSIAPWNFLPRMPSAGAHMRRTFHGASPCLERSLRSQLVVARPLIGRPLLRGKVNLLSSHEGSFRGPLTMLRRDGCERIHEASGQYIQGVLRHVDHLFWASRRSRRHCRSLWRILHPNVETRALFSDSRQGDRRRPCGRPDRFCGMHTNLQPRLNKTLGS